MKQKLTLLLIALFTTVGAWAYSGIKLTFSRTDAGEGTATNAVSDVTVNVTDMYGNALPGITAELTSTTITELKTGSATALGRTTNSVLAPNAGYSNQPNSTIEYTFCVTGLDTDFSYKYAALDVYALNGGGSAQDHSGNCIRYWSFDVQTGAAVDGVASFVSQANNDICTVSDESDGLYHKNWEMTAGSEKAATTTLYVKVVLTKTSDTGCYAGLAGVTLSGDQEIWESRNGWTPASGGYGSFQWYGIKTPGDASTTYSFNAIKLMQRTGSDNNDNYVAIAYSPATETIDVSQVIAISSDHHMAESNETLITYNFSNDVNLLGGSVYYIVFLSSNTPTNGAYPVRKGRLSLNHTGYGTYPYGNSGGSTGANFWFYYKTVTDLSATTGYCIGDKLGGTMESGNWKNLWTSGTSPSFTIGSDANNINNTSYSGGLDIRSGKSKSSIYTITAPDGYVITGYKLFGRALTTNQTVTPEGGSAVTFTTNGNSLCVSGLDALQTTFTLADSDNSGLLLHALQVDFEVATYYVTYIVKDGSDNVLFTSDPVATTNGANITTLPAEYQRSTFFTYNTVNVTISETGNTNVEFTATPKGNAPVQYTADTTNPYYYNLSIRSKYLAYNDAATGDVELLTSSTPFNPNAAWAFIGDPYTGFKIINQEKGADYDLTYTGVVPGSNHGNNNIQFVEDALFDDKYWYIEANSGGFCLRMKENTNIYFHHDSGNNFLRTCSVTEWSGVHNDAGSTIVASTDEDVLVDLYEDLQYVIYGAGIGLYTWSGSGTAEEARANISSAGLALAAHATSSYKALYDALVDIKANTTLNTPSAGFYRLRNAATNKYLTAISGPYAYTSTTRGVYANGDANSAATVIRLFDKNGDGKLYMYNQGEGFGWVDANKVASSGAVGYLSTNPDKYVNWFPGTASGQIGFAICYGNGTGSYASYLETGIYTVDTDDESVIAGTNSRANAAQWIVEEATTFTVPLNGPVDGSYYATLCVPFDVTLDGATAYTLNLNAAGTALTMTEVEGTVAAGTPVLLKGTSASATASISNPSSTAISTTTALTGTYVAKAVTGSTDYFLGMANGKVGFYHWDGSTLSANRAYLEASKLNNNDVKGFALDFEDDATSIQTIDNGQQTTEGAIYNLAGQRMNKMQKGINIINGKKILK